MDHATYLLRERGQTLYPVNNSECVVLPSREADPQCWQLVEDEDGAGQLLLLDHLRERYGVEPCEHLQRWATEKRGQSKRKERNQIVARARAAIVERIPADQAAELAELTQRLNEHLAGGLAAFRMTLEHYRCAGEVLLTMKERIKQLNPRPKWEEWVEDKTVLELRVAQRYMRLAKHWDLVAKTNSASLLGLDDALDLIHDALQDEEDIEDEPSAEEVLATAAQIDSPDIKKLVDAGRAATAEINRNEAEVDRLREVIDKQDDRKREEARAAWEARNAEERRQREEARERDFNLEEAITELIDALRDCRDGWPAGRRDQFAPVVREALSRLLGS